MRRSTILSLAALVLCCCLNSASAGWFGKSDNGVPAHPDELVIPPLEYDPPAADDFRHVLSNDVVCYIAEEHVVPLVSIDVHILVDEGEEPHELNGLHSIFADILVESGSGTHDATWVEEDMAFLGARLASGYEEYGASASISLLSKDMDHGLDMLFELLRDPAFQQDRLDQEKRARIAYMKERNTESDRIERTEWYRLIYSPDYFRPTTKASYEAISREDLLAWHDRWVHPGNMRITASGDFDTAELLEALEARFADWPANEPAEFIWDASYANPSQGVYLYDKEDANQTNVRVTLPGIDRDDPQWLAMDVMNQILGAGNGMSNHLLNRIRTQEGLAYSVGSMLEEMDYGPGIHLALFQTKTESTLYAMSLLVDEYERMAAGEFEDEELERIKTNLVQSFPTPFSSAAGRVGLFMSEELTGRYHSNPDYYQNYRERVEAITRADVQAAAERLLQTDELVWLVVGQAEGILAGDAEHNLSIEDFGPLHNLPKRDPMTDQPLSE